jgi:quercetin dioxygenase-like cupin family protein
VIDGGMNNLSRGRIVMRVARRCALAAGFIVIAAVAGGHVSARVGSGEAVQVVFARKLPNAPGKTLTGIVVDYEPGGMSTPHHHAGVVFAYVISGAVRSRLGSGETRVYRAGDTFFEDIGVHHAVSENASNSERARLLAVFIADDGARLTTDDP